MKECEGLAAYSCNWIAIAEVWVKLNKKKAAKSLEKAEALAMASDKEDWFKISRLWEEQGDKNRAKECYEKAI